MPKNLFAKCLPCSFVLNFILKNRREKGFKTPYCFAVWILFVCFFNPASFTMCFENIVNQLYKYCQNAYPRSNNHNEIT